MIIVMSSCDREDVNNVIQAVEDYGYRSHVIWGVEKTVIGCIGDEREKHKLLSLDSMPGVEQVVPILKPYKLASREFHEADSSFEVGGVQVGPHTFTVMAGPCSVESREQIVESARLIKDLGGHVLRGGCFKPRTSPYSFQGLELDGVIMMQEAAREAGLPIVTEVMTPEQVEVVGERADILQVGARNMQNYGLLKAVGKVSNPVLLKRGMMSTINEWLMSAEYVISEGNPNVILCERGIRTFETETRNTLDLSAVPVVKSQTHLPVFVDPSHGTGKWEFVAPMARAAVAAGADGIMVEVHPHPEQALSDGAQSLKPKRFKELMDGIGPLVKAMGRTL